MFSKKQSIKRFAAIHSNKELEKLMFTKVRHILGKLFLSGASFFWVSCDSASSAEESEPLIDIEQEMAKLTPPDTSGLRGQCTSVRDYCNVIDDYDTPLSGYNAKAPARDKVNELLNSKKLSDSKRNCYKRLAQSLSPIIATPEYGVPYCDNFWGIEELQDVVLPLDNEDPYYNDYIKSIKSKQEDYQRYLKDHNLTACSPATKGVFIDDQYINAALENEQRSRDSFRSDLEYINKQAAECDALE